MCSGCWPAPVRQYRQSYSCVCFCQGLWSLAMYCLVCSAYGGSISDGMVNVRRHSPVAAVSFMAMVGCVYLVFVLMCLKYFREHVLLNGFLLLVSICTYVMLASASYRMVLYVQQYQLTFLRILVLWFLAMLFVLMAGVVILIFNHEFPLFRFCLAVVSSSFFYGYYTTWVNVFT